MPDKKQLDLSLFQQRGARGFHGAFPELEACLIDLILSERAKTPFAPLVVILPTTRLVRYLKLRLLERTPGLLNLHLHTFNSLVHALMPEIPRLGQALNGPGQRLLAARVVDTSIKPHTYFAELKGHRGLPGSLLRVAAECERGGVTPARLRDLASHEESWRREKLEELAGFIELYLHQRDGGGHVDEVSLEQRAALAAPTSTLARTARAIFLYGFDELTPTMEALLSGLTRGQAPLFVLVPQHGPAALSELQSGIQRALQQHRVSVEALEYKVQLPSVLAHLRGHLFGPTRTGAPIEPDADVLRVISAPDPAGEVRAIARQLRTLRSEGHPYESMLVLFRRGEAYAALVEELFAEYQIPFQMGLRIPLHTVPIIRAFRSLLELIHGDLSRQAVLELLSSPYFRLIDYLPEEARQADVFAWDTLTRQGGVTRGAASWDAALRRLHRRLSESADDPDQPRNPARRRQLGYLETTLRKLRADLDRFPLRAAASSYVQLLQDLIQRLIDPAGGEFGPPSPRDRNGMKQLQGILLELRALDRLTPELSWSELRGLLEEELTETSIQQIEVEAAGVPVLDLPSARGLSADFVFLGGMVEGMLPSVEGSDPVLLGAERNALNRRGGRLDIPDSSGLTEKILFSLGVGAARRQLVLSYHRADGSGRETLVSSYLREVWKAFFGVDVFRADFQGDRPYIEELRPDGAESGAWDTGWELELIRQARAGTDETLQALARDRLAAWLSLNDGRQRAYLAEHQRWDVAEFTSFDGVLGPGWGPDPTTGVLSASKLELVASCPFRYLAGAVWHLEPLSEAEGAREVEAMHRGTLYHRILFELLQRWQSAGYPSLEQLADGEIEARAIAESLMGAFEGENPTGYRALWARDRRYILRDITQFIRTEVEAGAGFVAHRLEHPFGETEEESDPALKVAVEGFGELSVRGRIDRIDVDPARRTARVLDYKTGSAKGQTEVRREVERGLAVQLPLYLAAARAQLPEGYSLEGFYYYYVTERKGGFRLVGMTAEELTRVEDRVQRVLGVMAGLMRGGAFFPWPERDLCQRCDFGLVCRRSPQARFERKRLDPHATQFLALREEE